MGGAVDSGAPPSTMAVVVIFFFFLLLLPTTAVSGDGESTPLSFSLWNSSEYSLSPLTAALSKLGFTYFSMASHHILWNSPSPPPPAFHGPLTVFAPSDAYVSRCISCSLSLLLQAHTVSGLYPRFSLLSAATEIQTVIPGRCLTISSPRNSTDLFIGAAQVTHPDLFMSDNVIVHGVRGLISPHSCSLTSLSPSLPFSIPHVSLSSRFTYGHETVLVVTLDGILSLVEIESQQILWSIHTGQQIYSAYQDPEISNVTYVDCGEDWLLYRFDRHRNVIERLKSAKDVMSQTNRLSQNGITVVGQMGTTVYLVEGETRKMFRFGSGLVQGEKLIVISDVRVQDVSITRINYEFVAFDKFHNVLWNLSISEFESNSEKGDQLVSFHDPSKLGDVGLAKSNRTLAFVGVICGTLVLLGVIWCIVMKKSTPAPTPTDKNSSSKVSKPKKKKKKKIVEICSKLEEEPVKVSQQEHVKLDAYQVGKIWVSDKLIALGSNGTTVYEGSYELQRPVAVKKFVKEFYEVAAKEITNLVLSDKHLNVVRYFGMETDDKFIYLALEKCYCSLSDLVDFQWRNVDALSTYTQNVLTQTGVDELDLWNWNGTDIPSSRLLSVVRGIVAGISHLHKLRFIHRDLKPQNILLIKDEELCPKIADMGISKRILAGRSSITCSTGRGSSGWHAPEQLCVDQKTRKESCAVDLFVLGLIIYYCLTKGKHPFGEADEQDSNIKKNEKDLSWVQGIPEAEDLLKALLDPNPELRPPADEVLCHPLFWNSAERLSFIEAASNRLQLERTTTAGSTSNMLNDISLAEAVVFGKHKDWNAKVDARLKVHPIHMHVMAYDTTSLTDLVRLIRNNIVHYDKFPSSVRVQLFSGSCFEVDTYYRKQFQHLLIEVHKVIKRYCKGEDRFRRYFR